MEGVMNGRCLMLGMLLAASVTAGANEPLALRVSPAFSFAPANLVIQANVDPDADNRSMEVIADSAEFYRSSTIALQGERAPKTSRFEFRSLPPGDYQITATVIGANGRPHATAHQQVKVLESGAAR
jgi:hypothetical protein